MPNHYVAVDFTTKGATRVTGALKDIEKQSAKTAAATSSSFKSAATSTDTSMRKLTGSLKQAQGGIKGIVSGLGSLGGGTSAVAAVGLTTVAIGLKSLVDAGRDQERAMRLTQAVLQSTGGAAGVTASDVTHLATQLSVLTGVQDEVIQHGENVLLTFRSIRNEAGAGNDIFNQGTKSALDLSAALGQDLQSSVIQIGKALNDPIAGMTALRRVGVSFTESQKEQIKTLAESGHLLEAQKLILGELKAEFGGAAAAAADPFSKFDATAKELKETLGTQLTPALAEYVNLATKAASIKLPGAREAGGGGDRRIPGGSLLGFLVSPIGSLLAEKDATDKAAAATKRLDEATTKLNKDASAGKGQDILAQDSARVREAFRALHPEISRTSGALDGNAKSVDTASIAYAGLGANIKTAADALDALNSKAFAGIKANIDVTSAQQSFQDAISALNNPDTGTSGGGGGSTQTAISKALERADKEATLRDAIQAVGDADRDAKTAQAALTDARRNYDNVMQGVARNTLAAKEAEQAYTQAQDAAKSSVLDLRDAHRQLNDALEAQSIAEREATEALGSATRSRASARLDLQDAITNLANAREDQDPEEIARAQIALGDAEQRVRDATEAVTEARKAKTDAGKKNSKADDDVKRAQIGVTEASIKEEQAVRDLNEAHRVLEGTLHGFPATSNEAKNALTQYQDALRNTREAQDTVHDSATGLQRAQADLAGKLDAVGSSAASSGKKVASLASRLNDAKTAALNLAAAAGQADLLAGHSFGHSILVEIDTLKGLAAANPLLATAFNTALTTLEKQFEQALAATSKGPRQNALGIGLNLGHLASGGPVRAGRNYIVGEEGPELFRAPSNGEIVPHSALANSRPFGVAGGNVIINLNVQSLDPHTAQRLIIEALQDYSRKNGFIPRVRTDG